MNAAIVTASLSREAGGLHFAVSRLARALCDHGLAMSVEGLRDGFSDEDLPAWQPAQCTLHNRKGPTALGYAPSLATALIACNPALAHTHGIWQWPSAAVHRWHRRTGRPYVVSPHGMLDPWALALSRWKKGIASAWYESAHLRDAACLHALCQSEADSIRAYGLKNPVCIIPNGVDLVDAETLKTEKLKSEKKILLFLGRLHPKKGLVNAIRAWHALSHSTSNIQHSTFDEWQFVVAGWDQGGHRAELERLCREIGVSAASVSVDRFLSDSSQDHLAPLGTSGPARSASPTVLFLGSAFGEAKDALLRRADAFILPSFSEGLPMSVLEAWSYRLPVLMTDHCNLPEGFAADAAIRIGTDVESITEGMRLLLRSQTSDLRSLGQNGRSLVERQFTWPQVAEQMKEVYEWVLGGGSKPGCVRD
jgi:poly(glycerol-phosphate) alpha-glucosyltransferase